MQFEQRLCQSAYQRQQTSRRLQHVCIRAPNVSASPVGWEVWQSYLSILIDENGQAPTHIFSHGP
jgi:hypothetical protein